MATYTKGGASLKRLWEKTKAKGALARGCYTDVVLQEDLPETTAAKFAAFGRKFVDRARRHGARPLLFMAWAYARLPAVSDDDIAAAHRALGDSSRVDVAPVGEARARAHAAHPAIDLFDGDREHPSLAGAYLSACVIYGALFGGAGLSELGYVPHGLSAEHAAALRRVAAAVTPPADRSWCYAADAADDGEKS